LDYRRVGELVRVIIVTFVVIVALGFFVFGAAILVTPPP
jgi:hypothetical protein